MRLPDTAHTSRPWRIHEIAADFALYDVWALPTPGGPDDFGRLVRQIAGGSTNHSPSPIARLLFSIRWKLGDMFGWDAPSPAVGGSAVETTGAGRRPLPRLRDRLPADLDDGPAGPAFDRLPFRSVYITDDEWAAEIVNRTVHAVMHIGWVRDQRRPTGEQTDDEHGHRGQLAVLVKPDGLFGRASMAAIGPFRHLFVYPPLMRQIERSWRSGPVTD